MSERKVLQKYYPPDFDPSKITRSKAPKAVGPRQQTVRLMAPFSMKCLHCGEFIYKGRKFNARKENSGEKYYAITIFRFYIRCTRCSSEITFKTDPKNMDYTCERGAVRNFEPWRIGGEKEREESEEERLDRLMAEEEEEGSAMEKLETKTLDSRKEMMIADALDEIRTNNARNERVGGEDAVDRILGKSVVDLEKERLEAEDEEAARKAFENEDGVFVRRLVDGMEVEAERKKKEETKSTTWGKRKRSGFGETNGVRLGIKKVKNSEKGEMPPPPLPARVLGAKVPIGGQAPPSIELADEEGDDLPVVAAKVAAVKKVQQAAKPLALVDDYGSDSD